MITAIVEILNINVHIIKANAPDNELVQMNTNCQCFVITALTHLAQSSPLGILLGLPPDHFIIFWGTLLSLKGEPYIALHKQPNI